MGRMSSNMEKPGEANLGNVGGIINNPRRIAKQRNISNVPRISAWNPLSKGTLGPYKRKGMGKISENLASLWEIAKNDPPVYLKIERAFLPTNQDTNGLLFKSHL